MLEGAMRGNRGGGELWWTRHLGPPSGLQVAHVGNQNGKVKGAAQPDHALPSPPDHQPCMQGARWPLRKADRARRRGPPLLQSPPTPYLSAAHLVVIALQRCPSKLPYQPRAGTG